jgi:hypothetical protein
MMEAARTSETSVNFYQTTWRYNSEDSYLHTRRRENLKSYKIFPAFAEAKDSPRCLQKSATELINICAIFNVT